MSPLTLSEPFGKPFANPNFGKTPTPVPVPVPTTAPTTSPSTHQYQHRHLPNAQRVRGLVNARMNLTAVETTAEKSNLIEIPQAPATKRGTMTTPRTAASSDARKRLAEAGASESLPPVLLNLDSIVETAFDQIVEMEPMSPATRSDIRQWIDLLAPLLGVELTPPPVPREPWHDLPVGVTVTPLDAWVTFEADGLAPARHLGQWWITEGDGELRRVGDASAWVKHAVRKVELLSTHDPVTQVPVDRALIDEAARLRRVNRTAGAYGQANLDLIGALASLADAAVSKDAGQ